MRKNAETELPRSLASPASTGKVSIVTERQESFTGVSTSSPTTTNTSSAPSGRTYRVPVKSGDQAAGTATIVCGEDDQRPRSLADRMQAFQRGSSITSASGVSTATGVPSPKPVLTGTPPVSDSGVLSLHAASLTIEQVDAELGVHPDRLNERDSNSRTPLMAACFSKQWELAKHLINKGADVTAKDKFGASALIFCAMCGQFDVCLLLVSKGANPYVKNNVGN
jgi:hypothetical protein